MRAVTVVLSAITKSSATFPRLVRRQKVTDPLSRLMRCQPVAVRARTTTSPHGWIPLERTVVAPTDRLMALTWS